MENQPSFLDRFFHLSENGTTVRTEILAGITTFMTMAYILAVNPTIMSAAGMDKGAVLTATALASLIGTLCMAFFANYPGTGHGPERLLRLYGRPTDGLHLGNGPGRRLL